jgi:hypothetical protein
LLFRDSSKDHQAEILETCHSTIRTFAGEARFAGPRAWLKKELVTMRA